MRLTDSERPGQDALTRAPNKKRPIALLVAACVWIVASRIPLLLNADDHLDSDMAVDGLVLRDATQGQWRWHYPGTPHIGIPAVGLSLPQALIFGANPWTNASGGVVACLLVVVTIFALAWRVFGTTTACWTLLPLSFASTGVMWLSARVTGWHLLAVAWTAVSLILLAAFADRPKWWRALLLGLWCGVGLYVDNITLIAIAGIFCGFTSAAFLQGAMLVSGGRMRAFPFFLRAASQILIGGAALLAGYQLNTLGKLADPYDAYGEQFETIFRSESPQPRDRAVVVGLAQQHSQVLMLECLPRLIAGHRLPGLQTNPTPEAFLGRMPPRDPPLWTPLALGTTALLMLVALAGLWALFFGRDDRDIASHGHAQSRRSVLSALAFALVLYPVGFIVNKNIYNSDNYRYLVILIVPIALGTGLLFARLWQTGGGWRAFGVGLTITYAALATLDAASWYRRHFQWIDERGLPVKAPLHDPLLDWLDSHPEIDQVFANYWDVYRLRFLTGGRVTGVPYKNYPDRFDERRHLPNERPRTLLARRDGMGSFYKQQALRDGGRVIHEQPEFWVIDWP